MPATAPTEPFVSTRLRPFGASVFTEMSLLARKHGAVNLGQGFPDFDGPEFVKEAAIRAIRDGHGQYTRAFGAPETNQAIAQRFLKDSGLPFDPDTEITVTAGCTEAIAAVITGMLSPGDGLVLIEPFYDSYPAIAALAGVEVTTVTLRAPDFRLDSEALRAAIRPNTRMILVNTPHNPTGRVLDRDELEAVASLCRRHDLVAISDEVYDRLVYEGRHESLATLPGMRERTVTLGSLGKTFSLTGWKIGWAIAPAHLTAGIRASHQFLTFCAAAPLQRAAIAALEAPDAYFVDFVAGYRRRRDLLLDGLREIGFRPYKPQGSYFVLADHTPFGWGDDLAFCRRLCSEVGVAAIPPGSFYTDRARGKDLVRFAFCKKIETLEAALDRMRQRMPRPDGG
jgi:aspartate/methionine/tyrosine aminotransferase